MNPSMPVQFILGFHRDRPARGPFGDTHVSSHAHGHPRTGFTLCGLATSDLHTVGTPFNGFMDLLCSTCTDRLSF